MKRKKTEIKLEDIPAFLTQAKQMVKDTNPLVEQLTCVFKYKDESVIYMYPLLDWIDLSQDKPYVSFHLYQMVNN